MKFYSLSAATEQFEFAALVLAKTLLTHMKTPTPYHQTDEPFRTLYQ